MTRTPRQTDAGFSLLEVLVALAVLAVGAVSLLTATQTHVARISEIEARTVARWVADNRLAALRVGIQQPETVAMMGREWSVDVTRSATADADLDRVDVAVALSSDRRALFQITGFVDKITSGKGAIQ